MEADDHDAWIFYCRHATLFVQEFGLMKSRLDRLGYVGLARDVFEDRLSLIHAAVTEMRLRRLNQVNQAPAGTMYAEEPT